MIHSDWGDWLLDDVADASPDSVAIWYLGCNGFVLKGHDGTTIYIDPYLGLGDPPRTVRMIPVPFDPADVTSADAVFATHEHSDHVHGESQAPILEQTGATFYAPDDSLEAARDDQEWATRWDLDDDQFAEVAEGDTLEVGEFTVHVEVANDPDATHPVSYVFEHDSGTFFHGGDTKPSDEFDRIGSEYDIDLGVLAFGTVGQIPDKQTREPSRTRWYNDENQLVDAASTLRLERVLPSHWDMWRGLTADPKSLHHHTASFEYPRRVELAEIGDRVDL
ncbi:MBL fold metallo-hydrolase [Natronorubrum daqingense]|uniref:L-ascorbate 6-phosphate lactonase n=1 Tax=Natronorubrum daqingense TaxID=588898 RepID=A0A1N6XAE1_9EURY|nr:MBL fold metallo-hydrolase [Natronorubrum daqingense]APX96004.1 MBL fold metallo-hydrolase [Natronorubrum daqingense]SIQ99230.1 L-ascorbate 6-phosphate lactonase [Natronorubrum daqingense]